jgi:hypothetical protein
MLRPTIPLSTNDAQLADILRKLWPHRQHESNAFANVLCLFGFHRWSRMDVERLLPERQVRFCGRCPGVEIDGVIYCD